MLGLLFEISNSTEPDNGLIELDINCDSVVFPEPFSPIIPTERALDKLIFNLSMIVLVEASNAKVKSLALIESI